jgi:hypothetical protein
MLVIKTTAISMIKQEAREKKKDKVIRNPTFFVTVPLPLPLFKVDTPLHFPHNKPILASW